MSQVFQIVGALFILSAFVLSQMRRLDATSLAYLSLNFIGSLILAALAAMERQWGVLLLEGVWALVSAWGAVSCLRGKDVRLHS
ncbi:MAG: hypothetical protein V4671_12585 [Armatimonadota bacterium]